MRKHLVTTGFILGVLAALLIARTQPGARVASADQAFEYSGGTYDVGRLGDELVAAGITPITVRDRGAGVIEVVVADGVQQSAVTAVVNAHSPTATKASDLILVRRNAANDGYEIGRLGGTWSAWDPNLVRVTRKGADQANSTNALADCTGLDFPNLLAGRVYDFRFTIYFTAAAATTGLVLSVNGPASPTAVRFGADIAESVTARRVGSQAAYNAEVVGTSSAGATVLMAQLHGTLQTNASGGTLVVRFRSEVNGSAVTILRGSCGELK